MAPITAQYKRRTLSESNKDSDKNPIAAERTYRSTVKQKAQHSKDTAQIKVWLVVFFMLLRMFQSCLLFPTAYLIGRKWRLCVQKWHRGHICTLIMQPQPAISCYIVIRCILFVDNAQKKCKSDKLQFIGVTAGAGFSFIFNAQTRECRRCSHLTLDQKANKRTSQNVEIFL